MTRLRLKSLFPYLVCAVMLAVQGVPAHAHLDAAHRHDGSQHEHPATIHAHQPVIEHGDAFDFGHNERHLEAVVDLEPPYCASGHPLDQDFTATASVRRATPTECSGRFRPTFGDPLPNRPPPHVGEPRAPPQPA